MAKNTHNQEEMTPVDLLRSPDAVHGVKVFLGSLRRHGIGLKVHANSVFFDDCASISELEELAEAFLSFSELLDDKLSAHSHLVELGFEGIRHNSDYWERVPSDQLRSLDDGEWCLYDGIVFVRYRDEIDTTRAWVSSEVDAGHPMNRHAAYLALKVLAHARDRCWLVA